LRNLHWKSSNRPLRSINTLYLDLTKDGNDKASAPERRHQIPGLRQTPYVKIYLLRCDDNETYKATSRKQVREWIKNNAQQGESKKGLSSQENHDASEWLIVHIIASETPATAQSRAPQEARLGTTDSSDSIVKSKWPGKGSSTVFEKLRSDFNGSSKSAIERVAQIRIPNATQQTSADIDEQFHELVDKLKVTILSSFDLRVRQYEEHIREKDSQRGLPGWNFNTFFILKEGLARGFENVGLFDDALAVYDELSAGLETIIHEQVEGTNSDYGGRFLRFSDELKDKIEACLKDTDEGTGMNARPEFDAGSDPASRLQRRDYPLDASKTPFRELILSNEISIFDFRLYIFSRQLDLLLRCANAHSIADQPVGTQTGGSRLEEYFLPLAEACQRALVFITGGARTFRHDLELALDTTDLMLSKERYFRGLVISNFILSWMYVSSLQVLVQTGSPDLILPPAEAMPLHMTSGANSPMPSPANTVETGSWSLSRTTTSSDLDMTGRYSWPRGNLGQLDTKSSVKTGAEEFAGARAQLYLLARAAVQQIGDQHGWTSQWSSTSPTNLQNEAVDRPQTPNGDAAEIPIRPVINGLQHVDLRNGFQSKQAFKTLFGCLTMFSYRHLLAGKRTNSAEKTIAELAILKYEASEYEVAASYLGRLASYYSDSRWTALESTFLELYANCMRELGRHGEYVTSLLRLLGKVRKSGQIYSAPSIDKHLADLWLFSKKLTTSVSAKFSDFFSIKGLAPDIRHHECQDGFFIPVQISFIGGAVKVPEGLQMTLAPAQDSTLPVITLRSQPITIHRASQGIELSSNMSISGWYAIASFQIKIGNITFVEDYRSTSSALVDQPQASSYASLRFLVYPPSRSLQAVASPAPYLYLTRPYSILVEMKTGRNDIHTCSVSLKSGTAGLRLLLHDAKVDPEAGSDELSSKTPRDGPQTIKLVNCPADSTYKFLIPYKVENADVPFLNAKLDIHYSTSSGDFIYSTPLAVNTIIPIIVNAQDIFQENALLSRFTISPATFVPLRLWSFDMKGCDDIYSIECHDNIEGAMDVFPKQPANVIYKFTPLQPAAALPNKENSLALSVKFSCLDEVVLKAIEKNFVDSVLISPIANLVHPLCAHLLSTFRSQWSDKDLEAIGLCHEIEIWPFEDLGWDVLLKAFDVRTRALAKTWLKTWHATNPVMPIYDEAGAGDDVPSREVVIPVEIPTPSVVITASLNVDWRRAKYVTVGETLLADLYISDTRKWAKSESSAQKDLQLEISFEVMGPAENWVIGGARKGYLVAEGGAHSMPVILLPQRTGHLLLPSINIKCYKAETLKSSGTPSEGTRVPCEVDLRSLARSVHVASGFRETVVEIAVDADASGQAGNEKRTLLVASKGRDFPKTSED
jgi:trafficking protein particle complex subunit 10